MGSADPGQLSRRLATILSADAVGYSRRMAEDDAATVTALRSRRETFRGYVREYRGRIVGTAGDNVLAEFASTIDAVACALAVQEELARTEAELAPQERLPFRIGIHIGEVLVLDAEIFGDGINIAARLEGIAAAGGICASSAVVDHVRGRIEAGFEDIGDRELKNIPLPVRTYRVHPPSGGQAASEATTVPGFSGRPVIAVLPFDDRGGDPSCSYLAEAIAEEIASRLAAFRMFPVISHSSTLAYRERRSDLREIARDLRARYVVVGSVQSAAGRIRVTVGLVDGLGGVQIHSERHDREIGDVFALQDEIVLAIISSVEPALGRAERSRIRAKSEPQLDAWESFQRGASLLFAVRSRSELEEALRLFRRARELDRNFSTAAALETVCHVAFLTYHWSDDADRSAMEAMEAATTALALGDDDPWAHAAMGYACSFAGDDEGAIASFERAIDLNPSLTMAYQGLAIALTADLPDEAIRVMEKAIRLSPRDVQMHFFLHQLAVAHLMAGRFEEAITRERESLRLRGDQPHGYRLLAAALGHLGRSAEALEALTTMKRIAPGFSLEIFRRNNSPVLVELCLDGWRKAGWKP